MFRLTSFLMWLALACPSVEAFTVVTQLPPTVVKASRTIVLPLSASRVVKDTTQSSTRLYMAKADEQKQETTAEDEDVVKAADDVNTPESQSTESEGEVAAPEEEAEEPKEDPELTALKEEIAKMESSLKEKRRKLNYLLDEAEEYTKAGYARRVAEMENMRRARSMLNTSNKSSATAGILAKFLPVLNKLMELRKTHGEDDFGKQYNAVAGDMKGAFSKLGVTEYAANAGEKVDKSRVVVLDTEYSNDFPANTIIRSVSVGMELQGNVIRMAECIASLGPQPATKEDEVKEEENAPSENEGSEN